MAQPTSADVAKIGEQFPWVSFLGAVLFFLLFAVILCIVYVPQRLDFRVDQARVDERLGYLAEMQAKVKKEAYSYAWVDQKKEVVRLPIERAMDVLVTDHVELAESSRAINKP